MPVILDGLSLHPHHLERIANGDEVQLCEDGLSRMAVARGIIDDAVEQRMPVYGVTTGLGPKVVDPLPCLLYTSPSPRDQRGSRMPSSA